MYAIKTPDGGWVSDRRTIKPPEEHAVNKMKIYRSLAGARASLGRVAKPGSKLLKQFNSHFAKNGWDAEARRLRAEVWKETKKFNSSLSADEYWKILSDMGYEVVKLRVEVE